MPAFLSNLQRLFRRLRKQGQAIWEIILLKPWDLELKIPAWCTMFGPDQRERSDTFERLVKEYGQAQGKKCLQVGVPSHMASKYGPNFVALDLFDKREIIDYRCDLAKTSFEAATFDLVVCNAVLEHTKDPFACAREIERVTKSGGKIWIEVPFIQVFHPVKGYKKEMGYMLSIDDGKYQKDQNHGGDYWRFTPQGVAELFKQTKLLKLLLADEGGICFFGEKV